VTRFDWLLVFLTLLTFVGDDLELQSSAAVSTGKPPQKSETPVGGSSALIGVVLWRRLPVISWWRRWSTGRHAVIVGLPISAVARALRLRATGDGARERARADGSAPTATCYGADAGAQQSTAECATSRVMLACACA
jgi:hypothetical protein